MLNTIWFWLKIAITWFFVDSNRAQALSVAMKIYRVVKYISDQTDFQWDNESLETVAKICHRLMQMLDSPQKQTVAKQITGIKGPLNGIRLNYDSEENAVEVGYGVYNVKYSPADGSVKAGASLTI